MLNFFTAQNYLYAKLPAIATNGDFWGRKTGIFAQSRWLSGTQRTLIFTDYFSLTDSIRFEQIKFRIKSG